MSIEFAIGAVSDDSEATTSWRSRVHGKGVATVSTVRRTHCSSIELCVSPPLRVNGLSKTKELTLLF